MSPIDEQRELGVDALPIRRQGLPDDLGHGDAAVERLSTKPFVEFGLKADRHPYPAVARPRLDHDAVTISRYRALECEP